MCVICDEIVTVVHCGTTSLCREQYRVTQGGHAWLTLVRNTRQIRAVCAMNHRPPLVLHGTDHTDNAPADVIM